MKQSLTDQQTCASFVAGLRRETVPPNVSRLLTLAASLAGRCGCQRIRTPVAAVQRRLARLDNDDGLQRYVKHKARFHELWIVESALGQLMIWFDELPQMTPEARSAVGEILANPDAVALNACRIGLRILLNGQP